MARPYPSRPQPSAPASELKVFDALQQLDESWRFFHSVSWQSERSGRQGDGEADFVLVSPRFGLVVLEVKGGRVEVDSGVWSTIDRDGERHEIKNPYEQAKDSKYTLLRRLAELGHRISRTPVTHGVVFPDVTAPGDVGLYGARSITIDRADLLDVPASIDRLTSHWEQRTSLTRSQVEAITQLLAPTVEIRARLDARVAESKKRLIQLTDQQIDAFRLLRRLRRLVVLGAAGTGKTILATERARQLAAEGFRPLLVCYNAPLAEHLSAQCADDGVDVSTFHGLCFRLGRDAAINLPRQIPDGWWETEAPRVLVRAGRTLPGRYGAVVVDEGQDFGPPWFDALQQLVASEADPPFYLFADSKQQVYRPGWRPPSDWPEVPLETNCRNTLPIARRVAALFDEREPTDGAPGPEPMFVESLDADGALALIQDLCVGLTTTEGLRPAQIVVLADRRDIVDRIRMRLAGTHPFVALGQHGIVAETIHRYKGLESDVVVLVLSQTAGMSAEFMELAYVGMSRARTLLIVVADSSVRSDLRW